MLAGARPSRHCHSAECSLSTGSRRPSPLPRARDEEDEQHGNECREEAGAQLGGATWLLAGRDEALLVRERERHAALERPQRRADPREADDRVEDNVRLAPLEELDGVAADLGVLDAVLGRKAVEWRRARLQGAELELGMRLDDLDRLAADRAGRAEERHASHP